MKSKKYQRDEISILADLFYSNKGLLIIKSYEGSLVGCKSDERYHTSAMMDHAQHQGWGIIKGKYFVGTKKGKELYMHPNTPHE